jgi:hypothetical protein
MSAQGNWYQAGLNDGGLWARTTGTTAADLHMVKVPDLKKVPVRFRANYSAGYRVGVAKVRNSRYVAENGITPGDLFAEWNDKLRGA